MLVPSRQFTAPAAPHGDPAAPTAIAGAFRSLASEVRAGRQQLDPVFIDLGITWHGDGQRSSQHPVEVVAADAERVAAGLDQAATELDRYAAELARAQHSHHFSWGKLLKVGAVVVVSAGLVVVTVGAAAPEVAAADALIVGGELGTMTAAAGSATAAAGSSAGALMSAARVLMSLRGLAAAVRPTLPWAVGFSGLDAAEQEWSHGHLDLGRLATEFGINLVLPSAIGKAGGAIRGAASLADHPVAAAAAGHFVAGGVAGGAEVVREQLEHGHVSAADVAMSAGLGAGLSAAGGVGRHLKDGAGAAEQRVTVPAGAGEDAETRGTGGTGSPAAPPERPPVADTPVPVGQSAVHALEDPIDLRAHEGKGLGHTIKKHVGKTREYLQMRLDNGSGDAKSTFFTLEGANAAVQRVLRAHADEVRAYAGLAEDQEALILRAPAQAGEGWILTRDGATPDPTSVFVMVSKTRGRTFIATAYLE